MLPRSDGCETATTKSCVTRVRWMASRKAGGQSTTRTGEGVPCAMEDRQQMSLERVPTTPGLNMQPMGTPRVSSMNRFSALYYCILQL